MRIRNLALASLLAVSLSPAIAAENMDAATLPSTPDHTFVGAALYKTIILRAGQRNAGLLAATADFSCPACPLAIALFSSSASGNSFYSVASRGKNLCAAGVQADVDNGDNYVLFCVDAKTGSAALRVFESPTGSMNDIDTADAPPQVTLTRKYVTLQANGAAGDTTHIQVMPLKDLGNSPAQLLNVTAGHTYAASRIHGKYVAAAGKSATGHVLKTWDATTGGFLSSSSVNGTANRFTDLQNSGKRACAVGIRDDDSDADGGTNLVVSCFDMNTGVSSGNTVVAYFEAPGANTNSLVGDPKIVRMSGKLLLVRYGDATESRLLALNPKTLVAVFP